MAETETKTYSFGALLKRIERESREQWGPWRFERQTLELALRWPVGDTRIRYRVDLERCWDSASVLDWLVQVRGLVPQEAQADMIGNLLLAFDDLFRLQANACSCGVNKQFDCKTLLKKRRQKLSDEWLNRT